MAAHFPVCRPAPKVGLSGSNLVPPSAKNLFTKEMERTKERTKESNVTGQRKVQRKPMSGARGSLLRTLLRPIRLRLARLHHFLLLAPASPISLHRGAARPTWVLRRKSCTARLHLSTADAPLPLRPLGRHFDPRPQHGLPVFPPVTVLE